MDIEAASKALKRLRALEKARSKAFDKVVASFTERWERKRVAVLEALDDRTRELVEEELSKPDPGRLVPRRPTPPDE